MRKLLLTLAVLCGTVSAWAQINYGKQMWTFPATDHAQVSEVPADIFTDFSANYSGTELTGEKVGVYTTMVRVNAEGDVEATFQYSGGNIRMDVSGIDIVNAEGNVVASDYHFGYTGGNSSDNTYTLPSVAVGDYTLRLFVAAQKEDITSATTNDSRGTITLTGAWLYPNGSTVSAKNLYYIKNVRSGKYVSNKGEGKQFVQQQNVDAGSYWYFVEASVEDMKDVESIPEGMKPYWVYSVANVNPVENVTSGRFAPVDAASYPGKIYYLGVHTKDAKTGMVIKPYNEDAASWNDANGEGNFVGHYYSNDAGSLWSIEVANKTEEELIADATTAKNNALTSLTNAGNAYYVNSLITDAARPEVENLDVSTLEKACRSLISVDAIVAGIWENSNVYVTPTAGDRFIMKNKGRSGYLRAYAEGDVKASELANDVFALDLVWTLVATETDGEFKLYNERQGVYVGALSTSNNTKMAYTTDANQAGIYEVSQNGVYTLFHAKGQDAYGYMHLSNWGGKEIVRWDNGDASQWQLFKAPFELTTDMKNPICYAIRSGRDPGNYYFTLDANKVKLYNNRNLATDNKTHWFFMLDADKNLKIYPLSDKENPMGYITVGNGNTKLTNDANAANYAGDTYSLYFNDASAATYNNTTFAFRPTAGDNFVSNHGGTTNYMGFYNEYNDHGTRVAFEAVSYHVLKQKIEGTTSLYEHEGTEVNQYFISEETKAAVGEATITLNAKPGNSDDFTTAANSFVVPSINQPENGKFYRLRCTGGEKLYVSSVISEDRLEMSALDATNPNYMFVYDATEGNTGLLSYSQGKYITTHALNEIGSKTSVVFTSAQNGVLGQYNISVGNRYIYGRGNTQNNHIDSGTGTPTNANELGYNWWLEEVTSLPFTFKGAALGFATFNAPIAVELPEGISAYIGELNIENNTLQMYKFDGNQIPANTAVLLRKEGVTEDATVDFTIVSNAEEDFDGVTNSLVGTVAAENLDDTKNCYSLQKSNTTDKVGFYRKTTGTKGGFKAWVETEKTEGARVFTIIFDGEDATGIKEALGLENENVEIYDLSGRRLDKPAKGVNIIGGKTVIVR